MENKNRAALDDDALKSTSGGYIYSTGRSYYSIGADGHVIKESKDKSEIEDYNDEHNISNKEINWRQMAQLQQGINPFKKYYPNKN